MVAARGCSWHAPGPQSCSIPGPGKKECSLASSRDESMEFREAYEDSQDPAAPGSFTAVRNQPLSEEYLMLRTVASGKGAPMLFINS